MEVSDKVKKIAKYVTNILGMIGALLIGINSVEGITIPYATQIAQIIVVVQGVIGTYLLGTKVSQKIEEKKEETK